MRQQINLFNPALAPKVQRWPARVILRVWLLCVGVSAVLYAGAAYVTAHAAAEEAKQGGAATALQGEVTRVSQQLAARTADAALAQRLARTQALLDTRRQALARLGQRAPEAGQAVSGYFLALSRQVLSGVWLTGLSIERAGGQIVLQGRATDPQLLPRYLNQLRNEEVLRGHGFASLSVQQPASAAERPAETGYVEFRMASSSDAETGGTQKERR